MAGLDLIKKCIGQRLIVGFEGERIPPELVRLDEEWGLGGYILFSRNLPDFEQLMNLTEDLWARGQGVPHEDGQDEAGDAVSEVLLRALALEE